VGLERLGVDRGGTVVRGLVETWVRGATVAGVTTDVGGTVPAFAAGGKATGDWTAGPSVLELAGCEGVVVGDGVEPDAW
jgi:hypothetical protein